MVLKNTMRATLIISVVLLMVSCDRSNKISKTTKLLCVPSPCVEEKDFKVVKIIDIQPHYSKEFKVFETRPIVVIVPTYPRGAIRNIIEGEVIVELIVSKEGVVRNPIVLDSNPSGVFEKAALQAILKFRFSPRVVNYEAEEARVKLLFEFRIAKESKELLKNMKNKRDKIKL